MITGLHVYMFTCLVDYLLTYLFCYMFTCLLVNFLYDCMFTNLRVYAHVYMVTY